MASILDFLDSGQLQMGFQGPSPVPQGPNIDPTTLSSRIQEWLGAKDPYEAGQAGSILSARLPQESNMDIFAQQDPTTNDAGNAALQSLNSGGYVSSQSVADSRMNDAMTKLAMLKRLQGNGAGGGSSVFAQTMAAINADPSLANLTPMQKIRLAQNKVGTNLTMDANGNVSDMSGAAQGLGNLAYGEKTGGETATQAVKQAYEPTTAGMVETAKNNADIAATVPKQIAEKTGAAQGQKQVDLPRIQENTAYAKNLLNSLINHPGLPYAVGVGSYLPTVRGTPQADFKTRLNQINGQNFLQAFQTLRGGGQITEVEGEKATQAIARLGTSQSQEAFKQAAQELGMILDLGLKRAEGESSGNFTNQDFSNSPGLNLPGSNALPQGGNTPPRGGAKFLGFE